MRRARGELGFLMVAVLCIGFIIGEGISGRFEASASDVYEQLEILTEALGIIEDEYVEPVDTKELIYGALTGMLDGLDPHSAFMRPVAYEDLTDQTRGHFGGLGIVISSEEGVLTVITPMEGTPAAQAGILPGDRIIRIEGENAVGMPLREAVGLLRGPRGTSVNITVLRLVEAEGEEPQQKEIDVTLTREEIHIPSEKHSMMEGHIGYVRITEFKQDSGKEVKASLQELTEEGMNALVLDLRNNPGGLLETAAEISDLFLPKGQLIVRTESRNPAQNMRFNATRDPLIAMDIPIAVLVNSGSASASEIVAGALKDTGRGAIFGEQSFGKGSVQSIMQLSDGSAMRLTTAKYLTPSGITIHGRGITPDVEVKASQDLMAQLVRDGAAVSRQGAMAPIEPAGEEEQPVRVQDVQLDQALDFLRNYDRTTTLQANLQQLRERGLLVAAAPKADSDESAGAEDAN